MKTGNYLNELIENALNLVEMANYRKALVHVGLSQL